MTADEVNSITKKKLVIFNETYTTKNDGNKLSSPVQKACEPKTNRQMTELFFFSVALRPQ